MDLEVKLGPGIIPRFIDDLQCAEGTPGTKVNKGLACGLKVQWGRESYKNVGVKNVLLDP